jgi:hypothetical protein
MATLAGGCGGDYTVTGKVKVAGQPLNSGLVTFVSTQDQSERSASIGSDGSYTMYNPPKGEVIALVKVQMPGKMPSEDEAPEPPSIQGMKLPGKGQRPPEFIRVDERYAKAETSPLRYNVKHSGQKINIDLQD